MYIPENETTLAEVIAAYDFPETLLGAVRYGSGHINDTFCVVCQPKEGKPIRFILQGLSLAAFPRQKELMENFMGVTSHLRKKIETAGGDPMRETLNLLPTQTGKPYYTDSTGKVWRLTHYIENTVCLQKATAELFEASARAFGRFQRLLADFPAETLHETIVNFHNTEDRFAKFLAALEAEHNHSERVSAAEHYHPEDVISENMLGTIDDLMIKGYDGELCFERDFLGEAMDMISHFTVPSDVPEF